MREPFTLFRRTTGGAKGKMFYTKFRDPTVPPKGKYVNRRSVGSFMREVELTEELNPCKRGDARQIIELWRKTRTPT